MRWNYLITVAQTMGEIRDNCDIHISTLWKILEIIKHFKEKYSLDYVFPFNS